MTEDESFSEIEANFGISFGDQVRIEAGGVLYPVSECPEEGKPRIEGLYRYLEERRFLLIELMLAASIGDHHRIVAIRDRDQQRFVETINRFFVSPKTRTPLTYAATNHSTYNFLFDFLYTKILPYFEDPYGDSLISILSQKFAQIEVRLQVSLIYYLIFHKSSEYFPLVRKLTREIQQSHYGTLVPNLAIWLFDIKALDYPDRFGLIIELLRTPNIARNLDFVLRIVMQERRSLDLAKHIFSSSLDHRKILSYDDLLYRADAYNKIVMLQRTIEGMLDQLIIRDGHQVTFKKNNQPITLATSAEIFSEKLRIIFEINKIKLINQYEELLVEMYMERFFGITLALNNFLKTCRNPLKPLQNLPPELVYGIISYLTPQNFRSALRQYIYNTLLFRACAFGDLVFAKEMIECGAEVDTRNHLYQTPLIIAIKYNHPLFVSFLLEQGADPNLQDRLNRTPLIYTMSLGNRNSILEILMKCPKLDQRTKMYENSTLTQVEHARFLAKKWKKYFPKPDFEVASPLVAQPPSKRIRLTE